jgi:nickel transport protein
MRKCFLMLVLVSIAASVSAHGVNIAVRMEPPAVVVEAAYSGGEVLSNARFEIYAPDSETVSFQNGQTDANGMFAFLPDKSGQWKIVVDDGLGHRKTQDIDVNADFFQAENADGREIQTQDEAGDVESNSLPMAYKIVLGLCLIFGLTGAFYGFKASRKVKDKKH